MACNGRVKALPYNVVVLNQQASRVIREELFNAMVKQLSKFNDEQANKLKEKAEDMYNKYE